MKFTDTKNTHLNSIMTSSLITDSGSSFEDSLDEESGVGSDDVYDSDESDYPDTGDDYDYSGSSEYGYYDDDSDCDSMEYCTDVSKWRIRIRSDSGVKKKDSNSAYLNWVGSDRI